MIPAHLYVHVPFCLRRCSYCDFAVSVEREPPVAAWLDAIEREIELRAHAEGWTEPLALKTLYVGGGTPSLMGVGAMNGLARRLGCFVELRSGIEWTAEANPETFDDGIAADWRAAGVNRVSLGAQTFHAPALVWMGRTHGAEGPARAMRAARAAGFENVSVDLIFGLPERLGRDWDADLDHALALEPDHISLYGLTAEPATPLGRRVRDGRETLPDEDAYASEYLRAAERLNLAGYEHYEVSSFARPGRASRHNHAYWDGSAYLGLGPGAHSFLPPRRVWNVRDWREYHARLATSAAPESDSEIVDESTTALERVWLGLRTSAGLGGLTAAQMALAGRWHERGWAMVERDRVILTARGWMLLDRLAVEMVAA